VVVVVVGLDLDTLEGYMGAQRTALGSHWIEKEGSVAPELAALE